jgi:hypothetical protein
VIPIYKLPKRTNAQKIGESAADIFSATFTEFCNVVPIPQSRDLGIDFYCELMEGEYPTGLLFNAQCKGKNKIDIKNNFFTKEIKVTTINYWLKCPLPTILFIYDRQDKHFYWCFPQEFVSLLSKDWQSQEMISIPVEKSSKFSRDITEFPPIIKTLVENFVPNKFREITVHLTQQKILVQTQKVNLFKESSKTYKHLDAIRNCLIALLVEQNEIKQETIKIIDAELKMYWNLIGKIDYDVPELRQYMHTDSIFDEKFSAGIPRDIELRMTQCLKFFDANPSSQNLDKLLDIYSSLVQLNKDFYWVINNLAY